MANRDTRALVFRLAAEFMVIVIGVLVALGVDSWAANRRERVQEADYLERLLDDVRFDLQELAAVDSTSRAGLDASRQLNAPAGVDSLSSSRVVSTVLVAANVRVPDLSRSTFQELIQSGQIELIRSPSVRRGLASYDRTINELSEGWNLFEPGLRRWFAARIPLEIVDRFNETPGCSMGGDLGIGTFPVPCEFDLGGWSPERLVRDVRAEWGLELFRRAEHNFSAHVFFTSVLTTEARALEAVLAEAVPDG
jgi:hypothetical protein